MNNHAMALLDLGRLDEAKSEMTKVYEERKRQLGKEHPWTLWALCYLAKINIELGALSEAEEMLTWGIAAGERSLSKDHLGVLMGRGELGRVYARQGKLDIAEKLSVETIDLIEKSRGAAHPDCVYGLWKLTQLYQLKDDKAKAIKTCERALVNADMRIGRSHPLTQKLEDLLRNLQDGASNGLDDKTSHSKEPETQPIRRLKVHHLRTW
jgi:tetratricopeptide (TPR) repeat protein